MFRKTRYLLLIPLLLGFAVSIAVNAASGPPGSSENPVISKSYADKVLNPLREQLTALQTEAAKLKDQQIKPKFSDVPASHWAYSDIQFMVDKGIINGMGDGKFGPNNPTRRCELAAMLVKALNLPVENAETDFKDVPKTHWAYAQIAAVKNAGIISGFPGGEFKPNDYVTRGQIAVMLVKAYNLQNSGSSLEFRDVPAGYWAYDAIKKLADNNISKGFEDSTFRPGIPLRRAEVAILLAKTMDPARRK